MNSSKSRIFEGKWQYQYRPYMDVKTLCSSQDCAVRSKGLSARIGRKVLRQRTCIQKTVSGKNSQKLTEKGKRSHQKKRGGRGKAWARTSLTQEMHKCWVRLAIRGLKVALQMTTIYPLTQASNDSVSTKTNRWCCLGHTRLGLAQPLWHEVVHAHHQLCALTFLHWGVVWSTLVQSLRFLIFLIDEHYLPVYI